MEQTSMSSKQNVSDESNSSNGASKADFDETERRKLDAVSLPLVADTAHELRNLATDFRTRLYLTDRWPQQLAENLTTLEHLVNQLEVLVDQLVMVSRAGQAGPTLRMK